MSHASIKKMVDKLYKEAIADPWVFMNAEKGTEKLDLICQLSMIFETPEETKARLDLFNQRITEIMGKPYKHKDTVA